MNAKFIATADVALKNIFVTNHLSMTLQEQVLHDTKEAMKQKDAAKLSTLRMLKAALKNKEIDLKHELSDEEVLAVIKMQIKQLNDALHMYQDAGRQESVDETQAEILILEAYLPAQMSDEVLREAVTKALEAAQATSKEDMGKAMGAAMKAAAGQADGSRVRAIVEELLG